MASKRKSRWRVVIVVLVCIIAIVLVLHWPIESKITISREMTYILGPLNADGTVNYVAYLDAKASEGVTKDNNALILLIRALGPDFIFEPCRERVFKRLGIEPPGEDSQYFVSFYDWLSENPDLQQEEESQELEDYERLAKSRKTAWTKRDYPLISRWLDANAGPLELIVAASKRSRYYMPIISTYDPPWMFDALIPNIHNYQSAGRAMLSRAMRSFGAGDAEGAFSDILAVHRLARHMSQDNTLIGQTMANYIEGLATKTGTALAANGKLTAAQARAMIQDLEGLGPLRDIVEVIDEGERFLILDHVAMLSRGTTFDLTETGESSLLSRIESNLDWDEMLLMENDWYDKFAACMRKPTYAERSEAFDVFEKYSVELRSEMSGFSKIVKFIFLKLSGRLGRKERSRRTAKLLLAVLAPSFFVSSSLQDKARMKGEVERLAFALAAYHAERGKYPRAIEELAPEYLKDIPNDLFVEKPLKYKLAGKGYRLYSVGPDMKDDGGQSDREKDQDDIAAQAD